MPLLPLIDAGRHVIDLVYVGDVVEIMWQASQQDVAIGKVYNSASGAPLTMCQLVNEFRAVTGCAPRVLAVSAQTTKAWARVARWLLGKVALDLDEILAPSGIEYFSRDVYYDLSKAQSDLNYFPDFTFKRGLEMWWRGG